MNKSRGQAFQTAVAESTSAGQALQIVGTINAYVALMATKMGFKALYLSGAGVANASYGLPDLGIITLENVLEDASRITAAVDTPLLVDIDTGFGSKLTLGRTIKLLEKAGVAAVHIEDQTHTKRCGHRQGKQVVSTAEMCDRIKAATDARQDPHFTIMARTDALAVEGLAATIDRAVAYVEAGADMIFAEAFQEPSQYTLCRKACNVPLLANMTEFGVSPLLTVEELSEALVDMILYPLSANRAMNLAALRVFEEIQSKGTQLNVVDQMQTREELYAYIKYAEYESLI
jgi:methylisocitrate lyase